MKRIISIILIIVLTMSVTVCAYAEKAGEESSPSFEVFFLDVGKGDSAVVLCDGDAMIIDGGSADMADFIRSFLKQHGISHIEYMICTHTDSDHCGGLIGALSYATVGEVMCTDTSSSKKPFRNFLKYLAMQNKDIIVPNPGDTFNLGTATVRILAPEEGEKMSDDTSIILQIIYGDTSFLFTGDAKKDDEKALVDAGVSLRSTVLKIAHHGGKSSTSKIFLEKAAPEYAVISVGADQSGHPAKTVLNKLKSINTKLYRTDLQGTIHCVSDGKNVFFEVEKNEGIDTSAFSGT